MLQRVLSRFVRARDPLRTSARCIEPLLQPAWLWREVKAGPSYQLLSAYNWVLGGTGGGALLLANRLISNWFNPDHEALKRMLQRLLHLSIQELFVANIVLAGVVIARGPLARSIRAITVELAGRFEGKGHLATQIRPVHGAWLVARVSMIAPTLVLLGLTLGARHVTTFLALLAFDCTTLALMFAVSTCFGITAVCLHKLDGKHALLLWLGLWSVPEVIRLQITAFVTPRTLIVGALTLVGAGWGYL